MHFQGLLDRPTDPKLVVYKKQAGQAGQDVTERNNATAAPGGAGSTVDSNLYQNEQYLNQAGNPLAYQDFQKQLGGGPAGDMGLSNYSGFSGGQPPRIKSDFASSRKGARDLAGETAELTAKRPSLMQNMANARDPRHPYVHPADADGARSTRSFAKTQEEMWSEFRNHFRNPNRPV